MDAFLDRLYGAFVFLERQRIAGRIQWYGMATWSCFRTAPESKGYVSLEAVVERAVLAYKVVHFGGRGRGDRWVDGGMAEAGVEGGGEGDSGSEGGGGGGGRGEDEEKLERAARDRHGFRFVQLPLNIRMAEASQVSSHRMLHAQPAAKSNARCTVTTLHRTPHHFIHFASRHWTTTHSTKYNNAPQRPS